MNKVLKNIDILYLYLFLSLSFKKTIIAIVTLFMLFP